MMFDMKISFWWIILALLLQLTLPAAAVFQNNETNSFSVRTDPAPYLIVGDVVSFEITAAEGLDLSDHTLHASVSYPVTAEIGNTDFFPTAGRPFRARLPFMWDTKDLTPGTYLIHFSVQPSAYEWKQLVTLHSSPLAGHEQRWIEQTITCCSITYLSGSRAEQDIQALRAAVDEQQRLASERLEADLPEPIQVVFLPRVIGHGGFAGEELFISYPDINYTNIDLAVVLHHEIIHRLDRELGGPHRPSILLEGLAVYLSGGHYKEEDVVARSAALLQLGGYIPLSPLADNFYPSQHESGYMLAGALVAYLVDTYGWDGFSDFYRSIAPPPDGKDSTAIDAALQVHFGVTFATLEEQFIAYLLSQPLIPEIKTDVRLTLEFYDILRQYQQYQDPSAYFRNVWLFPDEDIRQQEIVSSWGRWPQYPQNLVIETLLESAGHDLLDENYRQAEEKLAVVERLLLALPPLESLPHHPAYPNE
jgi:hypothetical protein